MNEPITNTTRAALEGARAAFGRMTGAPPAFGAPPSVAMTMASRASDAWKSAEILLRLLTARADLSGQALLAEARRVDTLDMEGMHALVAMREWVERTLAPGSAAQMLTLPPTDAEREVASNAMAALDRSTPEVNAATPRPPSSWAPAAHDVVGTVPPRSVQDAADNSTNDFSGGEQKQRSISSGLILTVLLLVLVLAGAGAWFVLRDKGSSSLTQEGVDAYARGAKEAARISLAKAVQENPQDVRALTYLGRVSREQGDLATSRRYLEAAIRVDPNNGLALRELGSALLADNEFELARRFYVRALTADPSDRIAQGFLGCALVHLNRNEEAARWTERAGPGDWSGCATTSRDPPAKD
ncbi:MAG: tetratricopeptide repeat protein [Gemmatimonadaceae bacterium]